MVAKKKVAKSTKGKSKVVLTKGKKKTAIARARIKLVKEGNGSYRINKKPAEMFEPDLVRNEIMTPIWIASDILGEKVIGTLDIDVNVQGGGIMGQAEAIKTAVAKGIVQITESEELKNAYLNYDRSLLVDDVRRKEPKKYMHRGARARFQKSYR